MKISTLTKFFFLPTLMLYSSMSLSSVENYHGYLNIPPSRAFLCSSDGGNTNKNCGAVQYEPQSVEGLKGFPDSGPEDGKIASAGNPRFSELDEQSFERWHHVPIVRTRDGYYKFIWKLTAPHRTTSWQYYITKNNWDWSEPLTRDSFDLKPFCEKFDNGEIPESTVEMTCKIPDKKGYHLILGVWTIADTPNAFYQVVDLNFK